MIDMSARLRLLEPEAFPANANHSHPAAVPPGGARASPSTYAADLTRQKADVMRAVRSCRRSPRQRRASTTFGVAAVVKAALPVDRESMTRVPSGH
jgi:hypothetical protein